MTVWCKCQLLCWDQINRSLSVSTCSGSLSCTSRMCASTLWLYLMLIFGICTILELNVVLQLVYHAWRADASLANVCPALPDIRKCLRTLRPNWGTWHYMFTAWARSFGLTVITWLADIESLTQTPPSLTPTKQTNQQYFWKKKNR